METRIDEDIAWDLVRKLEPAALGGGQACRVGHESLPEISLRVESSGAWNVAGTLTEAASGVLELFTPLQLTRRLAVAQVGQSLDGRIATSSGDSHYVTGPDDIRRLHRLRATVDAVVVGAGTVAADDPRLTVRRVPGENPVRVVLDPRGRLDADHTVFTDGAAPTIRVRALPRDPGEAASDRDLFLPASDDGRMEPGLILARLDELGLGRVLVEGGGRTVSAFLEAGVLDRLHVTVAPVLIGSGPLAFELAPIDRLSEALRPGVRHFRLGNDILFDLALS